MAVVASDIKLLLSGGADNTIALNSLGGPPSNQTVNARLFNDITADEIDSGMTDFRCFYVANTNEDDTLFGVEVYVESQVALGASVMLGFTLLDEEQRVTTAGATGGSFTMSYDGEEFTVNYAADPEDWAINFRTALQAISGLEEVDVDVDTSGPNVIFTVEFIGTAGQRAHPLLEVVSNDLTPSASLSVARTVGGSPLNTEAVDIDVKTTPPGSVDFSTTSSSSRIAVGDLRPGDLFPVWVRRVCQADTDPMEGDGFTFRMRASPTGTP